MYLLLNGNQKIFIYYYSIFQITKEYKKKLNMK